MNDGRMQDTMAATLDPQSQVPAQSLTPPPAVSSAARAVLRGGANVRACLEELLNRGLPSDALVLVARALPKRYVVAWACDCLKTAFAKDPQTTDVDRAGLALAQAWLSDPTDDNRRAAMDYAERGAFGSPGAWIAACAGWCGGSLLPKGYDVVAPPDHLPAEAAVAALRLTASRSADYAGLSNGFVNRALQVFGMPAKTAGVAS
jgi:hypothetical protein